MGHRIEELGAFEAVGLTIDCPGGDNSGIGALWDQFFGLWQQTGLPGDMVGVSLCDGAGGFGYLAGSRVPAGTATPDGMVRRSYPAAKYAVWPFHDQVQEMKAAFQDIFANRLRDAGLTPTSDGISIETYPPDCWDPVTMMLKAELFVAVE